MAEMARNSSFHHTMSASGEPLAASPDDLDDAADGAPLQYWPIPYAPEHHVVITGERYGVELTLARFSAPGHRRPAPAPTVTLRGPITWIQAPQVEFLKTCGKSTLSERCAPR